MPGTAVEGGDDSDPGAARFGRVGVGARTALPALVLARGPSQRRCRRRADRSKGMGEKDGVDEKDGDDEKSGDEEWGDGMSPEEHEFVVRLRKVQWMLDDVAYQVPKNRSGAVDFPALAEALTDLATVVRHRGRNDPVEPTPRVAPGLLYCRQRRDSAEHPSPNTRF